MRSAGASGLKVSQRGIGHSAGGQSFCPDGIMIDMRGLDRILELASEKGTARGDDTRRQRCTASRSTIGPLIEAVESFRLIRADDAIPF